MKNLVAVILALALALGCTAVAEEASVTAATVGDAMNAEGYTGVAGGDDQHYVVILEQDGAYIRLVADLDDEARRLFEATLHYDDIDELTATFEAYNAYLATLPFAYEEEITAPSLTREELDALAGKTLLEVEKAGFGSGICNEGDNDEAVYTVCYGLYKYDLLLNETHTEYLEHGDNGYIGDLTVRSASFSGVSSNAVNLCYHADGTVDESDDPWAEYNHIMELITEALSGENPEDAIEKMTEAMPEHADEIRMLVEVFAAMGEQNEE